ncbi:hypothetical protein ACFY3G_43300 [Streptomyces phaeochromogenes]|uniref:hypothetical protein n=1 Tax=Streptomyces phaeochromogenes TaxID=1923 RepID=UPI00368E482F
MSEYDEIATAAPSDGGVGFAVWEMARQLEHARKEYVEATEQPTLLEVLLSGVGPREDGNAQ